MGEDSFNFENLSVYKKALDFIDDAYNVTMRFPKEERFILIDQFRRAAISISLNIAEGYGNSKLVFRRYLTISRGSVRECAAIITLSRRRNYIDSKVEEDLRCQCIELSKMLSGLMRVL